MYYYDKGQLKMTDAKLMNQMITEYLSVKKQIEGMPSYEFPLKQIDQTEQTKHFLKTIGISVSEVEGVCIERGTVKYKPKDEIDLEL